MKNSGTWLVIGIVGLAVVFAGLTWRNYLRVNPTSVSGRLERGADGWIAAVQFKPEDAANVTRGALALLTVPERPEELIRGTVESIEPDGAARIRLLGSPQVSGLSEVRATIDSEVVPDKPEP